MTWAHDELAADLAQHLLSPRVMIWTDMQLGPSGSPRPDVWVLDKSFARTRAITYECKVSTADFRADVTAGKWQSYLGFSNGVYFAAPSGLLSRDDVPKGCGLIVRGENGWRSLRAPTLQTADIDWVICRKLLIDGIDRMVKPQQKNHPNTYQAARKITKRWGERAATVLRDLDAAEQRIADLKQSEDLMKQEIQRRADKQREDAKSEHAEFLREIGKLLGTMPPVSFWDAIAQVREFIGACRLRDDLALLATKAAGRAEKIRWVANSLTAVVEKLKSDAEVIERVEAVLQEAP